MSQLASRRETKIEPSMDRTRRELCGEVTKIVWRDEFGTAVIAKLRSGETVRGNATEEGMQLGVPYRFMGKWANSDKYGWQFAFEAFLPDRPATHKGLTTYLAREVAGIGPATADRLWSLYGADAVEVLREDPERVVQDGVLRYEVAIEASRTLRSLAQFEKTTIDLFELFAGRGFPRDTVKAAIDKWGVRAADMVRRDPYAMLMAKFAGVGFIRADKLYLDLGYSKTQLRRQILCVWHAMETDSDGHTWFDPHYVRRVLIEKIGRAEMRQDKVLAGGTALRLLSQTVDATTGKTWITEAKRAGAESRAAVKLRQLMAGGRRLWPSLAAAEGLSDHQRSRLEAILAGPVAILAGTPGTGKAQPLDSKVLTIDGWKLMGDIEVGDMVAGSDGGFHAVTGVYPQGHKEIVRVHFKDGASVECCREHLWLTQTRVSRKNAQRNGRPLFRAGKVRTTEEIDATLKTSDDHFNHYVPIVEPIRFPKRQLPLDPYLLGLLIGDGCFRGNTVTFSKNDLELHAAIGEMLPDGVECWTENVATGLLRFWNGRRGWARNPLITILKELGLMGLKSVDKFIPDQFLFSSVDDRLALLQGLLDTDGTVDDGNHIEYSTSSYRLAEDARFIVESLGGRCKITSRIPAYAYLGERREGCRSYRVYVTLPEQFEPFRLKRKAELYTGRDKYQPSRIIVDIEPVGFKPAQCISVDAPDSLYVTDNCVLTHNTFSAAVLLREIVREFGKDRIAVCAPTGKAAVRISDALARYQLDLQATTIHRLLGVLDCKGGEYRFEHDAENPLRKDVVVVDETSMLDVPLFASLLAACPVGTNILFLGDPYQLPPVGHGCPLRDMMAAGVPNAILTEIKRQGETTAIVKACVQIKDGRDFASTPRYQPATGDNLVFVETESPEEQIERLTELVEALKKSKKYDAVADVQVLCSRNDAPEVGRKQLNLLLQSILNPAEADPLAPKDSLFRRGDKVMCLKNGMMDAARLTGTMFGDPVFYDAELDENTGEKRKHFLANGDMGVIVAVDDNHFVATFSCPPRIVKVKAKKRRRTWEDDERGAGESEDAAKFDLAYAVTVHKSQGSEWPIVIAIIDDGGGLVASREYHYTAISRASDACFLIGRRETIRKQCGRVALRGRKTLLRERLLGEIQ